MLFPHAFLETFCYHIVRRSLAFVYARCMVWFLDPLFIISRHIY